MSRCWIGPATALALTLAIAPHAAATADDGSLDLPHYAIGDSRTWSNGDKEWTEAVIAVDGDLATWQAGNGDIVETSANFVLPPAEYHQEAYGSGRSEIVSADGAIFPLESGKWVNLHIRENGEEEIRTRFCHVGAWRELEVAAGSFQVVEVSCQEPNRTKVWYYAPAIGTYVRYVNTHRYERPVTQDLVAMHRAGQ